MESLDKRLSRVLDEFVGHFDLKHVWKVSGGEITHSECNTNAHTHTVILECDPQTTLNSC